MKLALGRILSGGFAEFVPNAFVSSCEDLLCAIWRGQTVVRDLTRITSTAFPTDVARNEICRTFLASDAERLLFLDVDHAFQPGAVQRLLASDADIITGRYHVKRPPYHPNLYVVPQEDHEPGQFRRVHFGRGVFEIDRCGAGALLITREVIERVGDPWFRYGRNTAPPYDLSISEDFYFCERAQAEGFRIMADWDATFDHLKIGWVDGQWADQYLDLMTSRLAEKPELLQTVVACGYPDGYRLPSGVVVPPYARAHPVGSTA